MSPAADPVPQAGTPVMWTCPFCPLLCDSPRLDEPAALRLAGSDCPRALPGLAHQDVAPASPLVKGRPASLAGAVSAAAALLRGARQPLFGGLATDVAGARALYALAQGLGAIADPAAGAALMHGVRATQDRGVFTTTLAEVRARADLIVYVTEGLAAKFPELRGRVGDKPVVELGGGGDLFRRASMLAALVAGKRPAQADADLADLAARLQAARYSVLVWDSAALPAHGSLVVEAINRVVGTLNATTRSALLPVGGSHGAGTVNQVFTWLSGLPLRSRNGPRGLEHEPLRFDAARLLADHEVDALLWVSSFGPEPAAPATDVPLVLIGHSSLAVPAAAEVFIPVSTPGVGSLGHLFRSDGGVLLKLDKVRDEALPTVAEVVRQIQSEVLA